MSDDERDMQMEDGQDDATLLGAAQPFDPLTGRPITAHGAPRSSAVAAEELAALSALPCAPAAVPVWTQTLAEKNAGYTYDKREPHMLGIDEAGREFKSWVGHVLEC